MLGFLDAYSMYNQIHMHMEIRRRWLSWGWCCQYPISSG